MGYSIGPPLSNISRSAPDYGILPVVLYGCETWPLTFREEHRLRMFGNKVLRKIFGDKGDVLEM